MESGCGDRRKNGIVQRQLDQVNGQFSLSAALVLEWLMILHKKWYGTHGPTISNQEVAQSTLRSSIMPTYLPGQISAQLRLKIRI